MKLNKDKLSEEISSDLQNIGKEEVKLICDEMFDEISSALINNDRIEMRGFGSFAIKKRNVPSDPRKNIGNSAEKRTCNSVYFRMAKDLNNKLNKLNNTK